MVINCVQNGPQTLKKNQAIKQCMITVRSFSILVGGFNSPEKMKKYARHWGSLSISMVESCFQPTNRLKPPTKYATFINIYHEPQK